MKTAKVYGIQRSGNNWLMWLLAANYFCEVLGSKATGWTHGQMNVKEMYGKEPDAVFLIVRHPLAWLPSIWRYSGRDCEFAEFVKREDQIEKWNAAYTRWLNQASSFAAARFFFVRYEELLGNTETMLDSMCRRVAMVRKYPNSFKHAVGKMGKHMNETRREFDPTYYTRKRYINAYSPALIANVMSRVDGDVLRRLGYREGHK